MGGERVYKEEQLEHGVMIGSIDTKDGEGKPITLYTLGNTVKGERYTGGSVDVVASKTLLGWSRNYGVHTHTGDSKSSGQEEFSYAEANFGLNSDKEYAKNKKIKLYLVTPQGKLKLFDPSSGSTSEIYSGIPRHEYDIIKTRTFTDTHNEVRDLFEIVYRKIQPAPIINQKNEKKR